MVISTAKTLLLGLFGSIKHNFVDVYDRLDKETYFRMLKKLHDEEINELAWMCHLFRQTFNLNCDTMIKITNWAVDEARRFVRFLTLNGPIDSKLASFKDDSGLLLLEGKNLEIICYRIQVNSCKIHAFIKFLSDSTII